MQRLKMLIQQEIGAASIEYGLIAAFCVVGCMTAYQGLGTTVNGLWQGIARQVVAIVGS